MKIFRPENLRVRREFIGGQRMEVSWDHPKAQRPENGYRLVFAPFADVIDQKPWIEVVDGDTNTVSISSSNFEPPIRRPNSEKFQNFLFYAAIFLEMTIPMVDIFSKNFKNHIKDKFLENLESDQVLIFVIFTQN